MNFFFRLRQSPLRLFVVAQLLILMAFVWKDFLIFIFLSFAPIFALIDHPTGLRDSYLAFIVAVVTVFVLYFVMHMQQNWIISWVIYFAILGVVFTFYTLMQRLQKRNEQVYLGNIYYGNGIFTHEINDRKKSSFSCRYTCFQADVDTVEYLYRIYRCLTLDPSY